MEKKIVHVVIGGNAGDEGKGLVTAKIANAAKNEKYKVLNVLTNGGAQRGHAVETDSGFYVNKHFGSASCLNVSNYFSSTFILDPIQFRAEYQLNKNNGIQVYKNRNCRWVTPFDIMANLHDVTVTQIQNSCGMGIWNTIKRYKNSKFPTLDEFIEMQLDEQISLLKNIAINFYSEELQDVIKDEMFFYGIINHFIEDCKFMYMHSNTVNGISDLYHNFIIFENGQGLSIGDTGVDDPYKTPTFTGLKGVDFEDLNIEDLTVHYVSRTYETRHGYDPYFRPMLDPKHLSSYINEDRNNHYNATQGRFMYDTLNVVDLNHRIIKDLNDVPANFKDKLKVELDLTHCDEIGPEGIAVSAVGKTQYISSPNVYKGDEFKLY